MKKILAFILIACLLSGSICAFAEEELTYDFKVGYSVLGAATNFFV